MKILNQVVQPGMEDIATEVLRILSMRTRQFAREVLGGWSCIVAINDVGDKPNNPPQRRLLRLEIEADKGGHPVARQQMQMLEERRPMVHTDLQVSEAYTGTRTPYGGLRIPFKAEVLGSSYDNPELSDEDKRDFLRHCGEVLIAFSGAPEWLNPLFSLSIFAALKKAQPQAMPHTFVDYGNWAESLKNSMPMDVALVILGLDD